MSEEKDEKGGAEWMQKYWRPAMGWMYMLICLADMLVFPILWSLLQAMMHMPITQWNPLTLQGAGLFHIAMGAVLGISAFGRTQEKLAGTAANPTATQTISTQNMTGNVAGGFGSNQGGGFGGSSNGGFGSSTGGAPAFGASAAGGFGSPSASTGSSGFGSTPSPSPSSGFPSPSGGPSGFPSPSGGPSGFPSPTSSGSKIAPPAFPPI